MKRTRRVGVLLVLIVLTLGACVGYGAADRWSYPDNEAIAQDPGAYDGERVLLFGEIVSVDEERETLVLETETPSTVLQFTVEDVSPAVLDTLDSGGSLQVYGTLRSESSAVVADEVVVDFQSPADFRYVYVTSIAGGLLAAAYFLWHWRIDIRRLAFRPRGDE
jgi:hypothetical protein